MFLHHQFLVADYLIHRWKQFFSVVNTALLPCLCCCSIVGWDVSASAAQQRPHH